VWPGHLCHPPKQPACHELDASEGGTCREKGDGASDHRPHDPRGAPGAKTIPVQAGESATRRARSDRHRAATWLQLGRNLVHGTIYMKRERVAGWQPVTSTWRRNALPGVLTASERASGSAEARARCRLGGGGRLPRRQRPSGRLAARLHRPLDRGREPGLHPVVTESTCRPSGRRDVGRGHVNTSRDVRLCPK